MATITTDELYKKLEASIMMPPEVIEPQSKQNILPIDNTLPDPGYQRANDVFSKQYQTSILSKDTIPMEVLPPPVDNSPSWLENIYEFTKRQLQGDPKPYQETLKKAQEAGTSERAIQDYFNTHELDKNLDAVPTNPKQDLSHPLTYSKFDSNDVMSAIRSGDAVLNTVNGTVYRRGDKFPIAKIKPDGSIQQIDYTQPSYLKGLGLPEWGKAAVEIAKKTLGGPASYVLPDMQSTLLPQEFDAMQQEQTGINKYASQYRTALETLGGTLPALKSDLSGVSTTSDFESTVQNPNTAMWTGVGRDIVTAVGTGNAVGPLFSGLGKVGKMFATAGAMESVFTPNKLAEANRQQKNTTSILTDMTISTLANAASIGIGSQVPLSTMMQGTGAVIKNVAKTTGYNAIPAVVATSTGIATGILSDVANYDENGNLRKEILTPDKLIPIAITLGVVGGFGFTSAYQFSKAGKITQLKTFELYSEAYKDAQKANEMKLTEQMYPYENKRQIGTNPVDMISEEYVNKSVAKLNNEGKFEPTATMTKDQLIQGYKNLLYEMYPKFRDGSIPSEAKLTINDKGVITIGNRVPNYKKVPAFKTEDITVTASPYTAEELKGIIPKLKMFDETKNPIDVKYKKALVDNGIFEYNTKPDANGNKIKYAETTANIVGGYDAITGSVNGVDPLTQQRASISTMIETVSQALTEGKINTYNNKPAWMKDDNTPFLDGYVANPSVTGYGSSAEFLKSRYKATIDAYTLYNKALDIITKTHGEDNAIGIMRKVFGIKTRSDFATLALNEGYTGKNFMTEFPDLYSKSKYKDTPLQIEEPPILKDYSNPIEEIALKRPLTENEQQLNKLLTDVQGDDLMKSLLVARYNDESKIGNDKADIKAYEILKNNPEAVNKYTNNINVLDKYLKTHPDKQNEIISLITSPETAKILKDSKVSNIINDENKIQESKDNEQNIDNQILELNKEIEYIENNKAALSKLWVENIDENIKNTPKNNIEEALQVKAKEINNMLEDDNVDVRNLTNEVLKFKDIYDKYKQTPDYVPPKKGKIAKAIKVGLSLGVVVIPDDELSDDEWWKKWLYMGLAVGGMWWGYRRYASGKLFNQLGMNNYKDSKFNSIEDIDPISKKLNQKYGTPINSIVKEQSLDPYTFQRDLIILNAKLNQNVNWMTIGTNATMASPISGRSHTSISTDIINPLTNRQETVEFKLGADYLREAGQAGRIIGRDMLHRIESAKAEFQSSHNKENETILCRANIDQYTDLNELYLEKKAGRITEKQFQSEKKIIENELITYLKDAVRRQYPTKYTNEKLVEDKANSLYDGYEKLRNIWNESTKFSAMTDLFSKTGVLPDDIPIMEQNYKQLKTDLLFKKKFNTITKDESINLIQVKSDLDAFGEYYDRIKHSQDLNYVATTPTYADVNKYPLLFKMEEYNYDANTGNYNPVDNGVRVALHCKGQHDFNNTQTDIISKCELEPFYDRDGKITTYYIGKAMDSHGNINPDKTVIVDLSRKDLKALSHTNYYALQRSVNDLIQIITGPNIKKEDVKGVVQRLKIASKDNEAEMMEDGESIMLDEMVSKAQDLENAILSGDDKFYTNAVYSLINFLQHKPWNKFSPSKNYVTREKLDLSNNYLNESIDFLNQSNANKIEKDALRREMDKQLGHLLSLGFDNKNDYTRYVAKQRRGLYPDKIGWDDWDVFGITLKPEVWLNNFWSFEAFVNLGFNVNSATRNLQDGRIAMMRQLLGEGESLSGAMVDCLIGEMRALRYTVARDLPRSLRKASGIDKKKLAAKAAKIIEIPDENMSETESKIYMHNRIEYNINESVLAATTKEDLLAGIKDYGYFFQRFTDRNNRILAAEAWRAKYERHHTKPDNISWKEWAEQIADEAVRFSDGVNGTFKTYDVLPWLKGLDTNPLTSKFFMMMKPYLNSLEKQLALMITAFRGNNKEVFASSKALIVQGIIGTALSGIGSTFLVGDAYKVFKKIKSGDINNDLTPSELEQGWDILRSLTQKGCENANIQYTEEGFNKLKTWVEYGVLSSALGRNVSLGSGMFDWASPFALNVTSDAGKAFASLGKDGSVVNMVGGVLNVLVMKGAIRNAWRTFYMYKEGTLKTSKVQYVGAEKGEQPYTASDYALQMFLGDPLNAVKERANNVLGTASADQPIEKEKFLYSILKHEMLEMSNSSYKKERVLHYIAKYGEANNRCANILHGFISNIENEQYTSAAVYSSDKMKSMLNDPIIDKQVQYLAKNGFISPSYDVNVESLRKELLKNASDYYTGLAIVNTLKAVNMQDQDKRNITFDIKYQKELNKYPFNERGYQYAKMKLDKQLADFKSNGKKK